MTAKWHLHLTNNGSMLLRVDYEAAVKLEMTYKARNDLDLLGKQ